MSLTTEQKNDLWLDAESKFITVTCSEDEFSGRVLSVDLELGGSVTIYLASSCEDEPRVINSDDIKSVKIH
jgi:hypothetical protein